MNQIAQDGLGNVSREEHSAGLTTFYLLFFNGNRQLPQITDQQIQSKRER
jgi:hypothetical protein